MKVKTLRHLEKYGIILSAISLDIVILSRHAIVNLIVNRNALVETSTLLKSGIILSVISPRIVILSYRDIIG